MKTQGDNAELRFMLLSQELGYIISKPFGDNSKYDLIIDNGNDLEKIQIKSTSRKDTSSGIQIHMQHQALGQKLPFESQH